MSQSEINQAGVVRIPFYGHPDLRGHIASAKGTPYLAVYDEEMRPLFTLAYTPKGFTIHPGRAVVGESLG